MNTTLPDEILVLQEISSAVVRERNVRVLLGNIIDILHRRMGMLRGTFALLDGDELPTSAFTKHELLDGTPIAFRPTITAAGANCM